MTDITELAQLRAELSNPAVGSKDHLRKLALSLVEALEKAQTERDEFRRRFNLERSILEDADKDLETLRQRIAELESRAVTVKLPDYRNTYKGPFADEVEHQVRLALELFSSAAAIKWEVE